jgi:hypothetical protein
VAIVLESLRFVLSWTGNLVCSLQKKRKIAHSFPKRPYANMTYTNGIAPIVTVYGPGNLHHLSYASNGGIPNVVGKIPTIATSSENATNFLLGFSYTFTGYAFYWDGAGPAFWRVGNSPFREPVGTSWTAATSVPWGNEVILGANVQAQAATAVNRDNEVTAFFIPNDLD